METTQIAPLAEAVPRKLYGGTERVVSYLTEVLVRLGHEVTLFASGACEISAELAPIMPQALHLDRTIRDWIRHTSTAAALRHHRALAVSHLLWSGYVN